MKRYTRKDQRSPKNDSVQRLVKLISFWARLIKKKTKNRVQINHIRWKGTDSRDWKNAYECENLDELCKFHNTFVNDQNWLKEKLENLNVPATIKEIKSVYNFSPKKTTKPKLFNR